MSRVLRRAAAERVLCAHCLCASRVLRMHAVYAATWSNQHAYSADGCRQHLEPSYGGKGWCCNRSSAGPNTHLGDDGVALDALEVGDEAHLCMMQRDCRGR